MVTLSAIFDNLTASAVNQQINGLSRGATQLIERSRAIPINLDLPSLIRNGDSKRFTARVSSADENSSTPFDLKFQKIRAGVIRVTVSNPNSASERSATFDIHLNHTGKIRGFDTTGNGRINTMTTPNLNFTGNGPLFQFDFNDSRSGPVQFSQFSFPAAILDILQGTGNQPITGTTLNPISGATAGNDVLTGTAVADTIDGLAGDDTINGLASFDLIYGGDGNDTIDGGTGDDNIFGGNDNDTLIGGIGDDSLTGGTGTDTVSFTSDAAGVTASLLTNRATDGNGDTDTLSEIENLTGSGFNDTLTGDANANTLNGGAGNDVIDGDAGNDTLIGGTGNDTLTGGTGTDTADFSGDAAGVTANLQAGSATDGNGDTDTLASIENITGSNFNDTLTGDANANVLDGGTGNDTLSGGAGNDTLTGGAGNDTISGGAGNDTLTGGTGTDTLTFANDGAGVTANLTTNTATDGNGDTDTLSGFENVTGSGFNDTLTGDTAANTIDGGAGADAINGGTGNDTLTGGTGDDTFTVQDGTGTDTITDFTAGAATDDTIDLSGVASLTNFGDVTAAATDVGGDVDIDLGGGSTLTLTGVNIAQLDASDFTF